MASVASQVVFHPVVSDSLKFASTTLGRDKAYRAVQYFARFYTWYLLSRGDKDAAAPWNALKAHLGTARKLLRLGKPIEHLQAALRAIMAASTPVERITTIARQLSYFGYLSLDTLVWSNGIKFTRFTPETSQKIQRLSNRFWLVGILCSVINGIAKNVRLHKELAILVPNKAIEKDLGSETDRKVKAASLQSARATTLHQLSIDALDLWIPATGLGFANVNDGVLGVFGLLTSVLAAQKHWESVNGKK